MGISFIRNLIAFINSSSLVDCMFEKTDGNFGKIIAGIVKAI